MEINSIATSGTDTTIVDSTQTYTADQYTGYVVWVYAGTNEGEYREITGNTTDTITVSPAFTAANDNTSYFRITKLGYRDETVDGEHDFVSALFQQGLCHVNFALFKQRIADLKALGLKKRVGHSTTDNDLVNLWEQV